MDWENPVSDLKHPAPQAPSDKNWNTIISWWSVLERWGAAAAAENCWSLLCDENHNASKLCVSLETKINKYLTPSECICTYCEICSKELTVQLGNHSCLLLFEISLVFPVQLHLCVKLPPPGNPFSSLLGYLLLSSCVCGLCFTCEVPHLLYKSYVCNDTKWIMTICCVKLAQRIWHCIRKIA